MTKPTNNQQAALVPSWHGSYPSQAFKNVFVIGLAGYAKAGKTTIAEAVIKELSAQPSSPVAIRLPLAKRLKDTLDTFVGQNLDHSQQASKAARIYGASDWSVRDFMVYFATEFVRHQIGPDYWLDVVAQELSQMTKPTVVVIDDFRFVNEKVLVEALGVPLLVQRPGVGQTIKHSSEQPEKLKIQQIINNDTTPEQAAKAVIEIAKQTKRWVQIEAASRS